jgi:hypothetical protein
VAGESGGHEPQPGGGGGDPGEAREDKAHLPPVVEQLWVGVDVACVCVGGGEVRMMLLAPALLLLLLLLLSSPTSLSLSRPFYPTRAPSPASPPVPHPL